MKHAILLVLVSFTVAGCNGAGGVSSGGGASTPEVVLEKAEAARKAGNWKAYVDCHTPETISAIIAQNLETALMLHSAKKLAALGGPSAVAQTEKGLKPLTDIFAKHGIKTADLDQLSAMSEGDARQQAIKSAVEKIADKRGFAAEIMAMQQKEMTKGAKVEEAKSEIKNVTIEGDTATAIVSATIPGSATPFEVPMKLKKTAQGWKIDNTQFYE